MGFADGVKKLIGIEEYDPDEEISEKEIEAAKKELKKESKKEIQSEAEKEPAGRFRQERQPVQAAETKAPAAAPAKPDRRYSMTNTSSFKLLLIEPKSFEECQKLVDSLKTRRPIIINLEKLETEVARKIFDFLNGATYALNGNVQQIANNIFIFAPENVDIAGGQPTEQGTVDYDFPVSSSEPDNPWR